MKFTIFLNVILTTILVSCGLSKSKYAHQTPIDIESVDYITIRNQSTDTIQATIKRLTLEQTKSFIDKWNNASTIGPCKYMAKYNIEVCSKGKSKRNFRVIGHWIKEQNDWGFDLVDTNFIDQLWKNAK